MASSFAFRRSNVLGCCRASRSSTLLQRCQRDAGCQRADLPLFLPSQLTEIMQLMNAYFSATRCQQGKGDDVDISKAESTAVGFKHLASTLTPTLLELPSHPV